MRKIVAIVVTYNRCNLLQECLEALLQSETKADILIIDNASTDNTYEVIKNYEGNHVLYYNTGKNLGGAGGFHYGIRKAYELGYEYFWLMDDDTIVGKDSLTELVYAVKELKGRFGFLCGMVCWVDGSVCRMNWNEVSRDWENHKKYAAKGIVKVQTATFVSFLVRRAVVEEVGLPIKEYFIWGDDIEYSRRIAAKYPCYFVAKSRVTHKMKNNQLTNQMYKIEDEERIERMFYSIRNDGCTERRNGIYRMICYQINFLGNLIEVIIKPNRYKLEKIKVMLKGYINGWRFNPSIEYVGKTRKQ